MNKTKKMRADVVIAGAGLAGIVTADALLSKNRKVILLDRDTPEKLGGLAKESFGGVMMVDTPLQRRSGIKDSPALAFSDWRRVAGFSREDTWPEKWAKTYVEHSIPYIYEWLTSRGVTFLPVVNWPERGFFCPHNSLPRWHIAWGTGYSIIREAVRHLDAHPMRKNLTLLFGHRVEGFTLSSGRAVGVYGKLEETGKEFTADAEEGVVVSSGGICGGDLSKVRANWYAPWGDPPETLLNGSHIYADGLLHDQVEKIGGNITHLDRQWHYAAGIHYPGSSRPDHGLSLVPPRSALWVNALGKRIGPPPLVGYTDTRYLVEEILKQPGKYSWQIMNRKIALKELAVSGCDYMTAFRHKKKLRMVKELLLGNKELVDSLVKNAEDVITAGSVSELADKMNMPGSPFSVDKAALENEIQEYDSRIRRGKPYFNDDQLRRIMNFRTYRGDRLRTCKFQRIDDPGAYPLIAIREFILSRKSLGGIQTDLDSRVLDKKGNPVPGLYAVGESAGFGGGGIHGMGSLEGTFLGACILTGQKAGEAISKGM